LLAQSTLHVIIPTWSVGTIKTMKLWGVMHNPTILKNYNIWSFFISSLYFEVSFPRSAWECSWWRFASQKFKLFTTFPSKWRMPEKYV